MSTVTPQDSTNATGTPAVWLLHYWHRHGDDFSAHATPEGAEAALVGIVRDCWEDELSNDEDVPKTPDEISDEEATLIYFAHVDDEGFEIQRLQVGP